ncbi:hypothetical protein ScPMuIL_009947 [Solemya velum]
MSFFNGLGSCLTLKALLEDPKVQNPQLLTKDLKKGDESPRFDASSAFLGPNLWDKTFGEEDLKFEYMDFEEFLTENGLHTNLEDQLTVKVNENTNNCNTEASTHSPVLSPNHHVSIPHSPTGPCSPQLTQLRQVPPTHTYSCHIHSTHSIHSKPCRRCLHRRFHILHQHKIIRWHSQNLMKAQAPMRKIIKEQIDKDQHECLDFSRVKVAVDSTVGALNDLKECDGVYVNKLKEFVVQEGESVMYRRPVSESVKSVVSASVNENLELARGFDGFTDADLREKDEGEEKGVENEQKDVVNGVGPKYIDKIVENLERRFEDVGMIEQMKVLVPSNITSAKGDNSSFAAYGVKEVGNLSEYFGDQGIDKDECTTEYRMYKQLVVGSFSSLSMSECTKHILQKYSDMLPNISKLLTVVSVIPMTSVSCERGFSTQNRILTKHRTRLNTKTLEDLHRISEDKSTLSTFNFKAALQKWKSEKVRHTLYASSPKRDPVSAPASSPESCSSIDIEVDFKINDSDLSLVTIPGNENFNPQKRPFSEDELKPQPLIKKSKKVYVPDNMKDDRYWSRREKNNYAAKRSRDARRVKENQIAMRAGYLEKENLSLKEELAKMKRENSCLRKSLSKYEPVAP